jgi:hypothetical protein
MISIHLRDGRIILADHRFRLFKISLCQYGMELIPHLAVYAPGAVQLDPSLDRNGQTGQKHKQDGVHE